MVKVAPGSQQPPLSQQHQPNSAFASTQQGQHAAAYMQHFKQQVGMGQQHPNQVYSSQLQQQQQRRLGSTWTGYNNGSLEDITGYQTLAGLSAPGGIMDPATLIGGLDNIHDNQSM
jgi:outer membrane receptor for Fe3+-dicitrate